jgi:two-component system, OmpR family, phosphate regulon sensor histidine kinase PhoR
VRRIRPRTRLVAVLLLAAAAQAAVALAVREGDTALQTAAAVAVAAVAGAAGGLVPGLAAAALGWLLNVLVVTDGSLAALLALPAWIAAGGAAGWLATRRWQAARARALAEGRLAAVDTAATDAIVRVDADGAVSGWSPGAAALFGLAADEIVGRPLAELLADEDGDGGAQARLLADATRAGQRADREPVQARRGDGSGFTARLTLVPSGPSEAMVVVRDIGELRRAATRLRDLEARYRSLTEHLPVATYLRPLGRDAGPAGISRQIERLTGYGPEEWLADEGLHLRLVHPEDRDRVAAERSAALESGGLRSSYRLLSRAGRTVWVREEAAVVLDEQGRPSSLQGYLADVTERHAAEEERGELRAAEAARAEEAADRQRTLELVARAGVVLASSIDVRSTVAKVAALVASEAGEWCVVDVAEEDGTLIRLAAERAEPHSSGEAPGPHPEQAVLDVLREGRAELSESAIRLPLAVRGGRSIGVLTLLAAAHGRRYVADDLPWARALATTIALALDNARLHAEVEARSDANKVLTHVGDGVFLLDSAGVIRLWNPAAAAIAGVPAESALGRPAAEAFPGWQEISERIPAGTTQEPVRAEALPLETGHGERWISISGVEFFGGTVYAFRDITEEHRLDELKAEFIATASHELRTPLAAVYGAAQTLRRHDFALDDAGRARFISLIVDESEQLARIVNQILLANQLEVGRLDLVTEPFDAPDLLERVVEAAQTHAPPQITFEVLKAEHVPPVAADKDRVRQILVNLVENAVKYSPGGGRIELAVEPADGAVQFHVADEGLGIPAEERPRIFEKFYRLDPDMTQGVGGTGLGLYICSELVERMGGRIWVESKEGKGSAFFFELPAAGTHRNVPRPRDPSAHDRADSPSAA